MPVLYPPRSALSVIMNYRNMYKERYGEETKLDDVQIWDIFNTVFNDDDNRQQDEDRVEEMYNRSQM